MNYGRRLSLHVHPKRECLSVCSDMASSDQEGEERGGDETKRRTRNMSEKKRRDQFNVLISELGALVGNKNQRMDKTSVLRGTIQLLKQYNAIQSPAHEIREDWKPSSLTNDEFTQLMLEAIGGFILIFAESGVILYVSESVSPLLGYASSELVNQNFLDLLAPHERSPIRSWMLERRVYPNTEAGAAADGVPDFMREENQIRIQCQLRCGRGIRNSGQVEPTYRLVEMRGCVRAFTDSMRVIELADLFVDNDKVMLCCIARIIGQPIVREIACIPEIGVREFTTRHSMEWKFLFMDQRGPSVIGYLPFEVLGTSGFDYLHPDDLQSVTRFLRQLKKTGEMTSCFYRFMTKGVQWIWLQTRAHINYNQWNSKPEFITSVNVLVSEEQVRSAVSFLDTNDNICDTQCGSGETPPVVSASDDCALPPPSLPPPPPPPLAAPLRSGGESDTSQSDTKPLISSTVGSPVPPAAPPPPNPPQPRETPAAQAEAPCAAGSPDSRQQRCDASFPLFLTPAQVQLFAQLRSKHKHIRAIMRRQQTHLDRVSRVLSLAEAGRVISGSPCPSPPPPAPHHEAIPPAGSLLAPSPMGHSAAAEPKLAALPVKASVDAKGGLHEQLQELASSVTSEPLPLHSLPHSAPQGFAPQPPPPLPRLHSQVPPAQPPMPPLQAGGQAAFASAPAAYQAPLSQSQPQRQNSQHPLAQNFSADMGTDADSGLPSVMLPWPEYMPP